MATIKASVVRSETIEVDVDFIMGLATRLKNAADRVQNAANFASQADNHHRWTVPEKDRITAAIDRVRIGSSQNVLPRLLALASLLEAEAAKFDAGQQLTLSSMPHLDLTGI